MISSSEVRGPAINTNMLLRPDPDAKAVRMWHRDSPGSTIPFAIIVWSNREQTEIKLPDETVINPNPSDIILIENQSVLHRTPPILSEDRWFFRRMVEVPVWLEMAK